MWVHAALEQSLDFYPSNSDTEDTENKWHIYKVSGWKHFILAYLYLAFES